MKTVRVSVVIPAYNAARQLEGLLFDLAHQTADEPFEIVVADDASTDDTAAVAARYPSVRHLRSAVNEGPAAARNRGIQAARASELLLFVDADCRVFPTWVERHLAAHRAHRYEIIAGPVRGRSRGYFGRADIFASWYAMVPGRRSGLETEVHLLTPNMSVKRQVFEQIGLMDEGLFVCEDAEFCFRAMRAGLRTYFDGANEVLHINRQGFRATWRHHFRFGTHVLKLLKSSPHMPYGWVIPKELDLAVLGVPGLAMLHTGWLIKRWFLQRPDILLYLPAIYVLKLAHAAGIPYSIARKLTAYERRVPTLAPRNGDR